MAGTYSTYSSGSNNAHDDGSPIVIPTVQLTSVDPRAEIAQSSEDWLSSPMALAYRRTLTEQNGVLNTAAAKQALAFIELVHDSQKESALAALHEEIARLTTENVSVQTRIGHLIAEDISMRDRLQQADAEVVRLTQELQEAKAHEYALSRALDTSKAEVKAQILAEVRAMIEQRRDAVVSLTARQILERVLATLADPPVVQTEEGT